ncbi:uncharacterized protein [Argopecten irradians]|uniref:uncharacterized protein n=1 Tax=Argopecten irradians TaxID=31199 RepID=UPI003714C9C4
MPRTMAQAVDQGFTMVSDCGEIPGMNGKRFVKEGDYAVVLLYGLNGYIAGIQIGVQHNDSSGFPPHNQINQTFLRVDDKYFLTAYFSNPATICTLGRSRRQFMIEGIGTRIYIQNGPDPATNFLVAPMAETGTYVTKWTKGYCLFSMGVHYWYDIKEDMSCDDFFPVFLLYNSGRLNAFGWAVATDVKSKRMEHPAHSDIQSYMYTVPKCVREIPRLSMMHIYLTNPLKNFC